MYFLIEEDGGSGIDGLGHGKKKKEVGPKQKEDQNSSNTNFRQSRR